MVGNKLYIEGGGSPSSDQELRYASGVFFEKAGLKEHLLKIVAGHSREKTRRDFCQALESAEEGDFVALLVDAENAVSPGVTGWKHLKKEDGWLRPAGVGDDQVHLMVQCMEAWFLADHECLKIYFGRDFNTSALPKRRDVEAVPKEDLLSSLKRAVRKTAKRRYRKGIHSFRILAKLDPELVCKASPHARRLVDVLRQKL